MPTTGSNGSNSNSNSSWFGMIDRLCGCSYADAQLYSEDTDSASTFQGRSTTIPTYWMKDGSESPVPLQNQHLPLKPLSQQQQQQQQQRKGLAIIPKSPNSTAAAKGYYYDDMMMKEPSSPTQSFATATTVTMRSHSVASFDTTKSIARERTSSSLTTVALQQPKSFRRSQTDASTYSNASGMTYNMYDEDSPTSGGGHYLHDRHHSISSSSSRILFSVAFDAADRNHPDNDNSASSPKWERPYLPPRALRRVQTDSLTQLPRLNTPRPTATTTTTTSGGGRGGGHGGFK